MASAKFDGGKCKGGSAAKALMRHNDISVESRKIAATENPHIDISKSHLNFSFDGLTYEERCRKYDKRIRELDSSTNTNKRKDRVTLQGIEIPRPSDLSEDKIADWFSDVYQILIHNYGAENVIYGDVHMDEVHDYIDAVTKQRTTSREHAHFGVVPEVDGVLNGKAFFSRKNMRLLNNQIEVMTKQKYSCKFLTGEKRKSKETIDEIKSKSAELELQEQLNQIARAKTVLVQGKKKLDADKEALEADIEAFKAEKKEATENIQKLLTEASDVLKQCQKQHEQLLFMSSSYADSFNSTMTERSLVKAERSLVELDSKLSLAYDTANQVRKENDNQYV